jgi:hypothetical protein
VIRCFQSCREVGGDGRCGMKDKGIAVWHQINFIPAYLFDNLLLPSFNTEAASVARYRSGGWLAWK